MPEHASNPLYLHPALHAALPGMLDVIKKALPAKWNTGTGSAGIHRTPNEQYEIYKKGRTLKNGVWVKTGTTYTSLDGFTKKSRHNGLPATAVDIVLFRPNGTELNAGPEESHIKKGAVKYGFEWGGDWTGFTDMPHIQLPLSKLYKGSLDRDAALQWQKYLFHAGELGPEGELDGAWGEHSMRALDRVAGTRERTPDAWAFLFKKFGPVEDLADFAGMSWIPPVK